MNKFYHGMLCLFANCFGSFKILFDIMQQHFGITGISSKQFNFHTIPVVFRVKTHWGKRSDKVCIIRTKICKQIQRLFFFSLYKKCYSYFILMFVFHMQTFLLPNGFLCCGNLLRLKEI